MGRIMAIDFGTKRCGFAVTDPERIIATGLDTIATQNIFDFIEGYLKEEPVDIIVVGDPLQLDGTENFISSKVDHLVKVLAKEYPHISIEKIDERYSSKMAQETLIKSNAKKKTNKPLT